VFGFIGGHARVPKMISVEELKITDELKRAKKSTYIAGTGQLIAEVERLGRKIDNLESLHMRGGANISIIAAMDKNRLIGNGGRMPWHIPEDLALFRGLTLGKTVVMGRKTFESIGYPLAGRRNIVISRDTRFSAAGCEVVASIDAAINMAGFGGEVMVIGGAEIYSQCIAFADRLYLTIIDDEFVGDSWFPDYQADDSWRAVDSGHRFCNSNLKFLMLERI